MFLQLPVTPYLAGGQQFGRRIRRRFFLWATHLGDDVKGDPGTTVRAIGEGEVVWSEMKIGSADKRNWGGIVIVKHLINDQSFMIQSTFYSLYGHLKNLEIKKGERVQAGQQLGVIAAGNTPENGWWKIPHLHFAIYTGPWEDRVLPGYSRPDDWLRLSPRRTRRQWWHDPKIFIDSYNRLAS